MDNEKQFVGSCSFCNKEKEQVRKLIVGNNVGICNECIDYCQDLLKDYPPEIVARSYKDPREIKKYLDNYVIGQDAAKITVSVAVVNHYKRLDHPSREVDIDKANVLLLGPTGSGKTLIAKTIAKYLDVPFAIGDATSITEAGYVGDDAESLISRLINNANGDIERARRGIIFLDEVDKIGRKSESTSITRDVSGEGVQQALLKLVEGTICRVPAQAGGRKHPAGEMIEFDTSNVLFICSGAFVGLEDIVERRIQGSGMGFTSGLKTNLQATLGQLHPDDLVKYGLIPEFVGRFPVRVPLSELTKPDMIRVLTEVKNNYISQYQYLFSLDDIELSFDRGALELVIDRALESKTGARGLQSEIERVLIPHMYELAYYRDQGIKCVVIDKNQVNNPTPLKGD